MKCFTQPLVKQPYLQQTGASSSYICWQTQNVCKSIIHYGLSKNTLNQKDTSSNQDITHCLFLSPLQPNTKYYYVVNTGSLTMNVDTHYFYTAPPIGSKNKVRFLALGDCGSSYPLQYRVKSAINYFKQQKYINGVLLLGDNAYETGSVNEYQAGFFNPYQNNFILSNTCIYPAPGNHDYANDNQLAQSHLVPYYDVFNKTPQQGELGGTPSFHKEFYSFDYANIHFISLDSYGIENATYHLWDTLGPQYLWLKQDLQQNHSMWTIVYFHHPPFTMGTHNSDTENDLIEIRKTISRLLEKHGVDLVLNGHSHVYERSWLQKGHYNLETTFNKQQHVIDSSSAHYDGSVNSCPYKKDTTDNKGTVYVVAGEAGKLGYGQASYPHNSKCVSDYVKGGAFYFEVEDNRLDGFYVEEDSVVHDKFTMFKNVNQRHALSSLVNQTATLTPSWNGTYNWQHNGSNIKEEEVFVSNSSQFIVKDILNCLADTFKITITVDINETKAADLNFNLYPNPSKDELFLQYENFNGNIETTVINSLGKLCIQVILKFNNGNAKLLFSNYNLNNGTYFLSLKNSEKSITKSFFINR